MSAGSAATPRPRPAPRPVPRPAGALARAGAQARFETGILLRNGEQLLVALVLPVLALVGLTLAPFPDLGSGVARIDVVAPGTLALAVISTAFTGQAISTGFDRRYGVLRLLGVTPLGPRAMLAGKVLAVLAVEAVQVVVIAGVALALGWSPALAGLPAALVFGLLGTWAFVALALLLAGTLRAEAVLALANLVWVLLLALGGVLVPPETLPGGWSGLARLLPSGALADGLRAALGAGTVDLVALLVLLGWGGLASLAAARLFRWSD
ncbi:ABC transporter permease [Agilicoccus flavus]|uniref:ABC transporter permease n=1 Tax=Agilicoccus flavus TaxID=2775968 RepID=UPI00355843CF